MIYTISNIQQLAFWMLTGFITVLIGLLGYLFRRGIDRIYNKLDELVIEMKTLGEQSVCHKGQIESLTNRVDDQNNRLNNHGDRIRDLELNCAKKHQG